MNIRFEKPEFKIEDVNVEENHAKFSIEPLERGFRITLGNAIRRVLLSSLPGTAMYAVEIEGVRHEFSAISGVKEDVTSLILIMNISFSVSYFQVPIKLLKSYNLVS